MVATVETMTAPGEEIKSNNVEQPKGTEVEEENNETKPVESTETKHMIRMKTWSKLDASDVIVFRRPCIYRIPHFKGDIIAAKRLTELDVFKKANVIKVTLDKALECVRLQVIEAGKELIAGSPGLREAVFLHMKPPVDASKSSVRTASSRSGISNMGLALKFNSETKADLIIVGAVAVDKCGNRIGKGEGFSDLEFALLTKLGAIFPDAPIVTVVHDLQVYDVLPKNLFQPFDVPVDYIVTPTQVIEVSPRLPRPTLQWNLLSNRRVNNIPIIKQLLDREKSDGLEITLKEEDSDIEDRPTLRNMAPRRRFGGRRREMSAPERRGPPRRQVTREGSAPPVPTQARTRYFRRRMKNADQVAVKETSQPPGENTNQTVERKVKNQMRRPQKARRPRYPVDFSVRVDGLTSGIRVRDLKAALNERGVRPRDISWRGTKGVALLHFSKGKTNPEMPVAVDDIVASLQGLKVKVDGQDGPGADLNVEPACPITRIEVVDVAKV